MTTIVSRATKGSPLTHTELDTNFSNLNSDKVDYAGATPNVDDVLSWDGATWQVGPFGDIVHSGVVQDLDSLSTATADGEFIVATGAGAYAHESGATARTSMGVTIGTNVQAWDAQLDDLAALTVTNSNFIVGNGSNWVVETGATVRTSLGLGSAATLTAGVADNNVPQMDATGYPAADGSQITTVTPGANTVAGSQLVNAYERGWVWLQTTDLSTGGGNDFSYTFPASTYKAFKVQFIGIEIDTDDQYGRLFLNVSGAESTDAADYGWVATQVHNIAGTETSAAVGDESDGSMGLFGHDTGSATDHLGTASGESADGEIVIFDPENSSGMTKVTGHITWISSDHEMNSYNLKAWALVAEANDGFSIIWEGSTVTDNGFIIISGLLIN